MYFPYLYGRQSELLALRAANKNYFSSGKVTPIIEPVLPKTNSLVRCLQDLGKKNNRAIIVMNPYQGELKGGANPQWRNEIDPVLIEYPSLIPALHCRPGITFASVQKFTEKYAEREVVLLYLNASFTNEEMGLLAKIANVRYHICLLGKMTEAHLKILPVKKVVHINDHFNKQLRNADYSGTEHFTDRHKNFSLNGTGFGDYTVIGSEIKIGGGPPGAVAIHATYREAGSKDIWIQHFVSDQTDVQEGSPESKYLEAVGKLAVEHPNRVHEFGINPSLEEFFDDHRTRHFPGLGKNKERQIHHHIAMIHDILTGKL